MSFEYGALIEGIFTIIGILIAGFLVPWLKQKTTAEQRRQLVGWVDVAVKAAEQLYKGSGRGQEKLEYVKNWLTDHGVDPEDIAVTALIESAVYELTKWE